MKKILEDGSVLEGSPHEIREYEELVDVGVVRPVRESVGELMLQSIQDRLDDRIAREEEEAIAQQLEDEEEEERLEADHAANRINHRGPLESEEDEKDDCWEWITTPKGAWIFDMEGEPYYLNKRTGSWTRVLDVNNYSYYLRIKRELEFWNSRWNEWTEAADIVEDMLDESLPIEVY